ncbi:MAG TPA: phosphatidate cytidylyltransferase [Lentisphaeria bacterium]|nr:phosphatidate cytidylyltransferase [Lentisphaeria bacterium]
MLQRLKTALPLLAVFLLAFFLPGTGGIVFFILFALLMLATACHEAFTLINVANGNLLKWFAILAGTAMTLTAACMQDPLDVTAANTAITALFILAAFGIAFAKGPSIQAVHGLLVGLGVFLYLCWPLTFMPRIFFMGSDGNGRFLLFYIIAITKIADAGAYLVGTATARLRSGNHKLSPLLSPKKSWEGLLGGTLFSMLASLAFYLLVPDKLVLDGQPVINLPIALIIGAAVSIIGLAGDLAESALKRAANAKDSGHLPGIGGVLDTLDSLIPIAPFFFAFLTFMA